MRWLDAPLSLILRYEISVAYFPTYVLVTFSKPLLMIINLNVVENNSSQGLSKKDLG